MRKRFYMNRYNTQTYRTKNWEKELSGDYFVTINTKSKSQSLSSITNKENKLSKIGSIIEEKIKSIPDFFDYANIIEYEIMPDHVHFILNIKQTDSIASNNNQNNEDKFLRNNGIIPSNKNPMNKKCSAKIIRWLKGRVSFEVRKFDSDFEWQKNYYVRKIKNQKELENYMMYINNNVNNYLNRIAK